MPKKKENNLKTVIGVVLDESGSMNIRKDETIQAFNKYFDDVEETDPDALVTVAKFSQKGKTNVRLHCENEKVTDFPYLNSKSYEPDGFTPLYDAIGEVLMKIENQEADRYLFVIITDGHENASKEYNRINIQEKITKLTKTDKWTFVYLGADLDAWAAAQAIGINTINTAIAYSGSKGGTVSVMDTIGASTQNYLRSSKTSVDDFRKEKSA